MTGWRSGSLDLADDCPLGVQLHRVPVIALLLAVLQPGALMVLEQAVLSAEMSVAEGAVTYYSLRGVGALFE